MKRVAAIAAAVDPRALDAEPVAARRAFRIQTLHRPTGQILHFRWPRKYYSPGCGREKQAPPKRHDCQSAKNWRDCGSGALGSQEKLTQLVVVGFQICGKQLAGPVAVALPREVPFKSGSLTLGQPSACHAIHAQVAEAVADFETCPTGCSLPAVGRPILPKRYRIAASFASSRSTFICASATATCLDSRSAFSAAILAAPSLSAT
jgi:hypothetical protein